jgi:hypothetical protein
LKNRFHTHNKYDRICIDCGKAFTSGSPSAPRCGSANLGTGCSYARKLKRNAEWEARQPKRSHARKYDRIIPHPEPYRSHDKYYDTSFNKWNDTFSSRF